MMDHAILSAGLAAAHDQARAQFGKLKSAKGMLDSARAELTSLAKLGDMVSHEDVIEAAGKLVAAGLSPAGMAGMLADMPENQAALPDWLAQHAAGLAQREQQLEPVLAASRHQLGTSAMRVLAAQHLAPQMNDAGLAPAPDSGQMASTGEADSNELGA